jgi:hypothetical protein
MEGIGEAIKSTWSLIRDLLEIILLLGGALIWALFFK